MEIILTISKQAVLDEVAQKSAYVAAKMNEAPEVEGVAMDKIPTIDEDAPELSEFWDEVRSDIADMLATRIVSEGMVEPEEEGEVSDTYRLALDVWDEWNTALLPITTKTLFNCFVYGILGRWFQYVNKEELAGYAALAEAALAGLRGKVMRKTFTRGHCPF